MAKKKTWEEKYHLARQPEVVRIEKKFADIPANATMLIANPQVIEEYLRMVPNGHSVDVATIRRDLAAQYHAAYTCPVTTGIFLSIVAERAHEQLESGADTNQICPFWRAIAPYSLAAKKLSFGTDFVREMREKEGIGNEKAKKTKRG